MNYCKAEVCETVSPEPRRVSMPEQLDKTFETMMSTMDRLRMISTGLFGEDLASDSGVHGEVKCFQDAVERNLRVAGAVGEAVNRIADRLER